MFSTGLGVGADTDFIGPQDATAKENGIINTVAVRRPFIPHLRCSFRLLSGGARSFISFFSAKPISRPYRSVRPHAFSNNR
jgi:hypothetical protein